MANTIALNPWSVEGLILRGELTVPEMIEWAAKTGFDAIDGSEPQPGPGTPARHP
jgi:sugar phosphate isomerase/epimerase